MRLHIQLNHIKKKKREKSVRKRALLSEMSQNKENSKHQDCGMKDGLNSTATRLLLFMISRKLGITF